MEKKLLVTIAKNNAGSKLSKKMNLNQNITVTIQGSDEQTSTILSGSRYSPNLKPHPKSQSGILA